MLRPYREDTVAHRRLRSVAITLGAVPLLATGLTGCGSDDDDAEYSAVCVDRVTEQRVDDDECDDDNDRAHGWYFFPVGVYAGGIGQRVSGGSYTTPSASHVKGGVPKSGATIQRGGFGGGIKSGGTSGG